MYICSVVGLNGFIKITITSLQPIIWVRELVSMGTGMFTLIQEATIVPVSVRPLVVNVLVLKLLYVLAQMYAILNRTQITLVSSS